MKVIVVYGMGPQDCDDRLQPVGELNVKATAKFFHSISDYSISEIGVIVIPTGGKTGKSNKSEAEVMTKRLTELGIPEQLIVPEFEAKKSIDNVARVLNILKARDIRNPGLIHITTAVHMPRIKEICEIIGITNSRYKTSDEILGQKIFDHRLKEEDKWIYGLKKIPLYSLPLLALVNDLEKWRFILCQPRFRSWLKREYNIYSPEILNKEKLRELQQTIRKRKRIKPLQLQNFARE